MKHYQFATKMRDYSILYIEDDEEVRKHISEFLHRYCTVVYSCDSGEEGLLLYHEHQPDIILLDINLPGMSGIEFATQIRKKDSKTRIVISTAYTNETFMLQAIELALTRYLVKPVTSDELMGALEKSLFEIDSDQMIDLAVGYKYSRKNASIISENVTVTLRKKEAEVLEFFLNYKDEVLRYDVLENSIWSDGVMTRDAIRSQIRNLRKKIPHECFENIAGIGYRFKVLK